MCCSIKWMNWSSTVRGPPSRIPRARHRKWISTECDLPMPSGCGVRPSDCRRICSTRRPGGARSSCTGCPRKCRRKSGSNAVNRPDRAASSSRTNIKAHSPSCRPSATVIRISSCWMPGAADIHAPDFIAGTSVRTAVMQAMSFQEKVYLLSSKLRDMGEAAQHRSEVDRRERDRHDGDAG